MSRNKNIWGILKNRLCRLACYLKSVITAWKYLKNEVYWHFSRLDLILIWAHNGHCKSVTFAFLGAFSSIFAQNGELGSLRVGSNQYQIKSTKMSVYFIFQVLSCCNDRFSIARQSTKLIFQNTPNIFIPRHWSRYGMVFLMQTSLELLNVHATISFEGIRPWNDLKPGLGTYLEHHCKWPCVFVRKYNAISRFHLLK
jgi:hypothetical protein